MHKAMVKSESNQESISSENWTSLTEILLDSLNHVDTPAKKTAMDQATDDENAIVLLIFTSGTPSLPKACPHTSKGLWTSAYVTNEFCQLSASETLAQHLPTCHVFAVSSVLAYWYAGATVVLPENTLSAATTLESIESEQAKKIMAVPIMLLALRSHPTFSKDKVRCLEQIDLSGSVVSPELLKKASETFGVKASVGFGMSEGSLTIEYRSSEEVVFDHGYAGVGRAAPGVKIKICDPETRKTLFRGEAAIPRDRPIHEFTDSINVLRLIALVKKKTHKDLAMEDVLDAKDVKDLTQLLRTGHTVSILQKNNQGFALLDL